MLKQSMQMSDACHLSSFFIIIKNKTSYLEQNKAKQSAYRLKKEENIKKKFSLF